jgi:hypothetical protein
MRSEPLGIAELLKLPYLQTVPRDGRIVPLVTFWEQETADWYLYVVVNPGELGRMAGGEVISGSYVSSRVADPVQDIELSLGTLVFQHLSFVEVLAQFDKLQNDVHRCAAILEKYHLIWEARQRGTKSAALLIQSETEYLLLLLRSLYDLLQEVVRAVAAKLVHLDGSNRPVLKPLPKSFREVAMKGNDLRTIDDIEQRWSMPRQLAEWYAEEAEFFRLLRSLRDGIAHYGASPPTVFETEWGFAVAPAKDPWTQVHALLPGERRKNDLASLRGLFASCVLRAIRSTERFAEAIRNLIRLPEPILHDVKLFVRSPFGERLTTLESIMHEPWEARKESD